MALTWKRGGAEVAATSARATAAPRTVQAARLAGASRRGEPDGWYRREEGNAVNPVRTKTAAVGEEMAGGDEEKRR